MSEVVAIETPAESHATDPTTAPAEVESTTATPAFDEATWKSRLRGKDQALTAAQQRAKELEAEREALARRIAEYEEAGKSELQKALDRVAALEAEATAAKAQAAAATLARKFPLAAELLGDDIGKFDEARVAEIDGRLAKEQAEESEPRVDANSPRRTPSAGKPTTGDPLSDAKAALAAAGNPFFNPNE